MWRRDGRELFYVSADGAIMGVPITSGSRFTYGPELRLFQTPPQQVLAPFAPTYAVAGDGNTFLIRSALTDAYRTITVRVNGLPNRGRRWFE
jgi:hypothetical protein